MLLLQLTVDEMIFVLVVQFNYGVYRKHSEVRFQGISGGNSHSDARKIVVGRAVVRHQLSPSIGKGCIWCIFRHRSHHYRL